MDLVILLFLTAIGVTVLILIVIAVRMFLSAGHRRRDSESGGTQDLGQGWTATDAGTSSEFSGTLDTSDNLGGGGDFSGAGSGGSWGDFGGGDSASGDSGGGGGDGGGGGGE